MAKGLQPNNFDLIRLAAAVEVMLAHFSDNMHLPHSLEPLIVIVASFPGVPAFFFVSGFLISASWERHPKIAAFAENRLRRLFPALWLVLALEIVLIAFVFGKPMDRGFLLWIAAQATFAQSWVPSFLSSFPTTGINPALWTLPVEMGFYVAVPALYWAARMTRSRDSVFWLALAISFFALYSLPALHDAPFGPITEYRLRLSPVPWIGMFLAGVLAQRYRNKLIPLVKDRFGILAALYLAIVVIGDWHPIYPLLGPPRNEACILTFLAYAALVLSVAYTAPLWAERILRRNDLSYGIYIFHMPIANTLIFLGVTGIPGTVVGIFGVLAFAAFSWFFIEKPALSRKHVTIYQHDEMGAA